MAGEESESLFHRELQNIVDAFAFVLYFENALLEARAIAFLARQFNVGQKLHFNRNGAIAFAGVATAAGHVERKMPGRERKPLGLGLCRKKLAHQIEALDIRNGIRTRRPTNRRLVYEHYVVEAFSTYR